VAPLPTLREPSGQKGRSVIEQSGGSDHLKPVPAEVVTSRVDRIVVVTFTGTLDMLTTPRLASALDAAIAEGPAAVIADLSHVDFMASAGMTVLIVANEKASEVIRFGVVTPDPITSRPMKLIGLHEVISMFDTLEEAVSAVGGDVRPTTDQPGTEPTPPELAPS
jgi:anti-anti-sigma factor